MKVCFVKLEKLRGKNPEHLRAQHSKPFQVVINKLIFSTNLISIYSTELIKSETNADVNTVLPLLKNKFF